MRLNSAVEYCEAVRELTDRRSVIHQTIGWGHTIRVHIEPDKDKLVVGVFDTKGAFAMGCKL